ncbi:hypothetical protein E4U40_004929 [Claviceps sp. LM458 group G5]|nr:hypothetical protein E4U40_004929 [Claviceps sp. LM458 group G5]KAG6045661.1 hypothetical protein E4U39_002107 [Claviceps sp. Clav50 group G5]
MKLPKVDSSVCGAALKRSSASLRIVQTTRRNLCKTAATEATVPQKKRLNHGNYSCPSSSEWISSTFKLLSKELLRPHRVSQPRSKRQRYSTESAKPAPATQADDSNLRLLTANQDKNQLMSLVRGRGEGTVQEHFDSHRDYYQSAYGQTDGFALKISDDDADHDKSQKGETANSNEQSLELVAKLCSTIGRRIRHPHEVSLESIYKIYRQLPAPRISFLTQLWRERLLRVMGTPQKRDVESMLRYFALVADVKSAGLTLRHAQWNYALTFATKHLSRRTEQDMESILRLWKEMEKKAHVMGNEVTFNVLFDAAIKRGNFTLADMIYQEMESRGIPFNRFHHVSLIYYFGLRLDSAGIRAAYKEMVEAGEMIDTVVLNCVISGLLRCGEEDAVEETYQRMKNAGSPTPQSRMPGRSHTSKKVVPRILMMFAKIGKEHPELKETFQASTRLSPDLQTYLLLIQHFAMKVGSLEQVAKYLGDMKQLNVPLHPTLFLALFKGFHRHGGFPGSEWSEERLRNVLKALVETKDAYGADFKLQEWPVVWALRAAKKCSTNELVLETFYTMSERWDIKSERREYIYDLLYKVLEGEDIKSMRSSIPY